MAATRARARTRAPKKVADAAPSAPDSDVVSPSGLDVQHVPLASIDVSGRNPRRKLSDIDQLAESIQAHGLLQPPVVRPTQRGRFELIAGHRRLEALRRLGFVSVPVVVRPADVDSAYLLTLVENLQRADLQPREEAAALETLVRERGWTTRQIAAAIQRSQAYVSKRLRVFEDPLLAPAVLANQLSVSAAEELLTLGPTMRYELLSRAVEEHWDRQHVRTVAREGFAANHTRRQPALRRRVRQLRMDLRDVTPDQLSEADRRELRLLFSEMALLARAPDGPRKKVFPPMPGA
jgi:ParB family chromosome partitioning protein